MAKKRTYPTPTTPPAGKKVSVKKIIDGLDKVLTQLGPSKAPAAGQAREIERARKALVAARAAVESACLPEFYLPS